MRKIAAVSVVLGAGLLTFCPFALTQEGPRPGVEVEANGLPGPGWKAAPRSQNPAIIEAEKKKYKVEGHPFDPHDLEGVWGNEGIRPDRKGVAFTEYGKKLHDATKTDVSPKGIPLPGSKDPEYICDPLGFPRNLVYNYGFEFVQTRNRVFEFFDWGHAWRTIWTDGRKLPTDPPYQRFEGYAVGRWEGDTFIVESNGYDDRSWIMADGAPPGFGFPHSEEMQVEERYKRLNYGTLQVTLTITDPKVYTAPWITTTKVDLFPGAEIGEYFCVPSESLYFDNRSSVPSAGAKASPYSAPH